MVTERGQDKMGDLTSKSKGWYGLVRREEYKFHVDETASKGRTKGNNNLNGYKARPYMVAGGSYHRPSGTQQSDEVESEQLDDKALYPQKAREPEHMSMSPHSEQEAADKGEKLENEEGGETKSKQRDSSEELMNSTEEQDGVASHMISTK